MEILIASSAIVEGELEKIGIPTMNLNFDPGITGWFFFD